MASTAAACYRERGADAGRRGAGRTDRSSRVTTTPFSLYILERDGPKKSSCANRDGWNGMESKQVKFPNKKRKEKKRREEKSASKPAKQEGRTQLAARAQKAGGLLAGQ